MAALISPELDLGEEKDAGEAGHRVLFSTLQHEESLIEKVEEGIVEAKAVDKCGLCQFRLALLVQGAEVLILMEPLKTLIEKEHGVIFDEGALEMSEHFLRDLRDDPRFIVFILES